MKLLAHRAGQIMTILVGAALSAPASAQVIEIDSAGAMITYCGPTLFRADGSTAALRSSSIPPRGTSTPPAVTAALMSRASGASGISPDLIEALAWRESRFHAGIVSGAVGEMQLMPATARQLGGDPFDSQQNYLGGANNLGSLLRCSDGNLVQALAAYNAGPHAVDRYGAAITFPCEQPQRVDRGWTESAGAPLLGHRVS